MASWSSGSTEAIDWPPTLSELIMSSESPSSTASVMPISCPNSRAREAAIASISIGWSAGAVSWVKDAITAPVWSRITSPIPLLFSCLKIAPSKFILKQLTSG